MPFDAYQLEVKDIPGMGRGVCTKETIREGALVAICYSWILTSEDLKHFERMTISGHWFFYPDRPDCGLLAIGMCGLINHSSSPNVALTWRDEGKIGIVGRLHALRDIALGEQLLLQYKLDRVPERWVD